MIQIKNKSKCCGCGACEQRCPKHCISLIQDEQGFLYPNVDVNKCVECGICEQVCPIINVKEKHEEPLACFAAINPDEKIRIISSSGGIFTLLAEDIIHDGGTVFGAKFNDKWDVVHDNAETNEGIISFRGSKYVQSVIGDCYDKVEQALKQGRKVLFTGTPCQISGLRHFLRQDYDNLLLVEVACHGVPSPMVWKDYLNSVVKNEEVKSVTFRNQSSGWKNYCFTITLKDRTVCEPYAENLFIKGFLNDLYLRPSCYRCVFKAGCSLSDITIADFWGVDKVMPKLDDDKGVSLLLVNSVKGECALRNLKVELIEVDYSEIIKYNPSLVSSVRKPCAYNKFWRRYASCGIEAISKTAKRLKPVTFRRKIVNAIKDIL